MSLHTLKDGKPRDVGVVDHKTVHITSQTEAPLKFSRVISVTLAELNAGKWALDPADIPAGKSVWLKTLQFNFSGVAFGGATLVRAEDSEGTNILSVTVATSTGEKVWPSSSYPAGTTAEVVNDRIVTGSGGIKIAKTGGAATGGGTFYVFVEGEFV